MGYGGCLGRSGKIPGELSEVKKIIGEAELKMFQGLLDLLKLWNWLKLKKILRVLD